LISVSNVDISNSWLIVRRLCCECYKPARQLGVTMSGQVPSPISH